MNRTMMRSISENEDENYVPPPPPPLGVYSRGESSRHPASGHQEVVTPVGNKNGEFAHIRYRPKTKEKIFYLGGDGSSSDSGSSMHTWSHDDSVEEDTSKGPTPNLEGYALSVTSSDMSEEGFPFLRFRDPGPGWTLRDAHEGEDCEFLEFYYPGGYCPIVRHDVVWGADILRDRKENSWFRVVQKLGVGGNAAAWLVKDMVDNVGKYLALKILRNNVSTDDDPELKTMRRLGKLYAAFMYTSPRTHEKHLCLAMEPLGMDQETLTGAGHERKPLAVDMRSIHSYIKAVVNGVLDLHAQNICHGDISPGNIAWPLAPNAFTPKALRAAFEEDRKTHIFWINEDDVSFGFPRVRKRRAKRWQRYCHLPPPRPDCLPDYIIRKRGRGMETNPDLSTAEVIDFGSAFEGDERDDNVRGTVDYMSPEARQVDGWYASKQSDLWSLGCVLVQGLTGVYPFLDEESLKEYVCRGDGYHTKFLRKKLSVNPCLAANPRLMSRVGFLIEIMLQSDPEDRSRRHIQTCLKDLDKYVENWSSDLLSLYMIWMVAMVDKHGEKVRPHLDRLFLVLEKIYTVAQKSRKGSKCVRHWVSRQWRRFFRRLRAVWHAIRFGTGAVCSVSRHTAGRVGKGSALLPFSM